MSYAVGVMLCVNVCNMSIARFGFLAIFISYVVLLLAEYLRPGFVATNVNVHWLWVVMVGWVMIDMGMRWWRGSRSMRLSDREDDQAGFGGVVFSIAASTAFGIILGLIVWRVGEVFGGMRLLFAFVAAVTPFLLVRSVRTD